MCLGGWNRPNTERDELFFQKNVLTFFFSIFFLIFLESSETYTKRIIQLFKSLTAKKSAPLLWNVHEKMSDPKKKSPPNGVLLKLKMLSLHDNQDIPYVQSHLLFFSIKIRQLV